MGISKKRRKDSRLILLYKGLKGKARIPTDDLIPKYRRCRNQHSLAFRALTTIFGNGARAPGIGKISGVSVKIGKIVYRQTRLRTLLYMVIWLL